MLKKASIVLSALTIASAVLANDNVVFSDAVANASLAGTPNSSAFVSITNKGAKDVNLVTAATTISRRTEFHDMQVIDGVMKMRASNKITLPAGQTIKLQPGGKHIMLLDLTSPLKDNANFTIKFTFDDGSSNDVTFKVKARK